MSIQDRTLISEDRDRTQRQVLLFVRAPELGRVKTRLEKKMDAATVQMLYQCFVQDIMETLGAGGHELIVFFTPLHKESAVRAWLGNKIPLRAQTGESLGDRMRNAFLNVFAGDVDQAVLIGSDFPDLDNRIIDASFEYLNRKDVVIGPAVDGGYYLIGLRKHAFGKDLFSGIDWGTGSVFRQTLVKIHDARLRCHMLPSWQDIDTHDDLVAFYRRSEARGHTHLKTMKFLRQLDLKEFQ